MRSAHELVKILVREIKLHRQIAEALRSPLSESVRYLEIKRCLNELDRMKERVV